MMVPHIPAAVSMQDAWDLLRNRLAESKDGGETTPESRAADEMLSLSDAHDIRGVIAKLRAGLTCNSLDKRVEGVLLSTVPLAAAQGVFDEVLARDDYPNECVWTSIRSLERMLEPRPDPRGLIAELEAANARTKSPFAEGDHDKEVDDRNKQLYDVVERIQALPNTRENLAARAAAVCSAVDYTVVASEMTLTEFSAHAESNAGELVREILACLLDQVPA